MKVGALVLHSVIWTAFQKRKKNNTFVVLWAMIINVLFTACLHGGGGPQVGEVTRLAVVENKTRLQEIYTKTFLLCI